MKLKQTKCLFIALSIILGACSTQQEIKTKVVLLTDSIQKPYVFLSELSIISNNNKISKKANIAIQNLSENQHIEISAPKERLILKKKFLQECFTTDVLKCKYTPEKYKILTNIDNILSLEYSYNNFGSYENWNKYACFDLETGEQLTFDKMLVRPEEVLKKYNKRYIVIIENHIDNNKQETEEEKDEYQSYKEHLKTRELFIVEDLNSIEFVYTETKKINSIRFHYHGSSGNHRQLFPSDYIEFTLDELKPYFSKSFKDRIKL